MDSSIIKVKNAFNNHDTESFVIIQNDIDYIPKISVIIPVYNNEKIYSSMP